jgi:hypothetical protein
VKAGGGGRGRQREGGLGRRGGGRSRGRSRRDSVHVVRQGRVVVGLVKGNRFTSSLREEGEESVGV